GLLLRDPLTLVSSSGLEQVTVSFFPKQNFVCFGK
ncbi:MAG: hypothetical protein ACI9SQ_002145, partial [Rubritalea sp.]